MCLGALNEESVVTYIEKATGLKKYGTKYDPNNVEKNLENGQTYDDVYAALSGEHLSCSGLLIDGTSRGGGSFEVTPDGNVLMKDSSITLSHGEISTGKYVINIDPEKGIYFGQQLEPNHYRQKVHLDIKTGNATFSGTVTASDVIGSNVIGSNVVGSLIIGGTYFAVPDGYDQNNLVWDEEHMLWDIPGTPRLIINSNGLVALKGDGAGWYATRHGISLEANNGFGTLNFYYNGDLRGKLEQGGGAFALVPMADASLILGAPEKIVHARGQWDFSGAEVTGLS